MKQEPRSSTAHEELDMQALVLAALFVFGGLFTYTIVERSHRARWRLVGRAGVRTRAPAAIRRTALWSIYMGQMALPGGLLGLLGTFYAGIGLVSIPGMILALRIWRLGFALLRRDAGAEREARALDRFAVVLNLVGLLVALVLVAISRELAPVSAILVGYAAVSFAHAKAMRRCAELLAAERTLEPVRARAVERVSL